MCQFKEDHRIGLSAYFEFTWLLYGVSTTGYHVFSVGGGGGDKKAAPRGRRNKQDRKGDCYLQHGADT